MKLSPQALRSSQTGDGYSWQHAWSLQDEQLRYRGFRSAPHPATLPVGFAYSATNFRCGPGEPFGRRLGTSTAVAAATGLPSGTFKGLSPEYDDGTYKHWVIAWLEADADVHLYWRIYTKATGVYGSWTQVTQDSGKFGDTALVAPANNGRVQFFWAEVPGGDDTLTGEDHHTFLDDAVCFVTDGASVRSLSRNEIMPAAGTISGKASHAKAIQSPVGNLGVEFDAYDWLDMSLAASVVDGGTDWAAPTAAASVWTFATAAGAGSPAVLTGSQASNIDFDAEEVRFGTYATDTSFFQCRQLILVAHSTKAEFWKNADFAYSHKTGSGAYAYVAFDNPPLVLPTGITNYELVVFDFPDRLPKDADSIYINGFQITSRVTTPVSTTVTIYAMGVGGVVRGGTQYGICRVNIGGQVYSPGVVVGLTGFGTVTAESRTANTGVLDAVAEADWPGTPSSTIRTHSRALPDNFMLPIDSRVFYTPKVKYSSPHQGDLDTNAANYVYIYRKEPRDRDFYRVDRIPTAAHSGTWGYSAGFAESSTETFTDQVSPDYREFRDTLPDESCTPCKPFQSGRTIGPRAYVLEDTAFGCQFRVSEYGSPVRFVEGVAQSADQKGGFNLKIPNEKGRAVAQTVSGRRPKAVYAFTDQSVWRLVRGTDGIVMFDLALESALGCCAPGSVTQLDSSLCWLDKNRDFRALDSPNLSRFKVDEFDAVPDGYISVLDSVFWKGRCYTTLVASGGTEPTQAMVYNFALGEYESLDTYTSTVEPEQWIPWREAGANKLYYVGADGAFYEYEKAAQYTDAGQAVAWLLESREFANSDGPNWDPIGIRHMGLVGTDLTSGTITCTRIFTSPAQSLAGTINVDVTTAYAWKQDTKSSASSVESPGGEGNGVRLRWNGSLSAAFECYALVAEAKNVELGGHGA